MLNSLFARFTRTEGPEADRRRETRKAVPGGTVEIDGRAFAFTCKAMMVRVDPEAQKLVGAFVEMDAATRAKLARYFD